MLHIFTTNPYLWIPVLLLLLSCIFISIAFFGDWVSSDIMIYYPLWIPLVFLVTLAIVVFLPHIIGPYGALFDQAFVTILSTTLIWLPILLLFAFWDIWMYYIRAAYIFKLKWIMLELKIPQEVTKSPLAMETFLMSLHQTGNETTFLDRHWKGQIRPYFSLEIISIEGNVKFYIYTQERYKKFIEAGLYAQYQNIEIHEAPDYSHSVALDSDMDMYIIDFKKKASSALPIRTYIDYGLDNDQQEEETKIDPISHLVEFLGSIGANQQCWLQIVMRAHKGEQKKPGTFFAKTDRWKDEAKEEIEKIRAAALPKDSEPGTKFPNPTRGEQDKISAIERGVSKLSFDVGIRSIYMGKKDFFQGTNITGQRTMLRSYSAPHLNALNPTNWMDGFDYPWEDFRGIRKSIQKKHGLEAYKRRAFFYGPHSEHSAIMVLSVEELASLFHLPGQVVQTPSLGRLVSKKGQAPGNLPI